MNASLKFFGTLVIFSLGVYLLGIVFTEIVIYLVLATLLTTFLLPITERIAHFSILGKRVTRTFAALIGFLVLMSILTLFGSLFVPLVKEQLKNIASLDNHKLSEEYRQIIYWADGLLLNYGLIEQKGGLFLEINDLKMKLINQVQVKNVFSMLFSLTGNVLVGLIAVFFMTFFFLVEKGGIRLAFLQIIPNRYFEFFVTAYHKIQALLMNYLTGLLLQMVVVFSLTTIGLTIIDVRYAVTVACFTAVANLIPYAGPFLGATFGALIGISTSTTLGPEFSQYLVFIGKIAVVFATVQFADNIFLQPIIFSKSVKAHPLEIFVVIFAGGNIAGVIGMIVAIPVYTILKVALIELKFGYTQYHIFKN